MNKINHSTENAESVNNNLDDELQCILSLSYEKQHLASAFYKINSGELFVSYEIIDLPPYYTYLQNLLRLLKPEYCLASGSYDFQKFLMKLLRFNEDQEPHNFRVTKKKNFLSNLDFVHNKVKFLSFTQDIKQLHKNYQIIINTRFSGSATIDKKFNVQYLQSYLPLEQDLVVHSLGNLLQFLNTNLRHLIFEQERLPLACESDNSSESKIILNDIEVFYLQSHVAITDNTINSLGIFSQNPLQTKSINLTGLNNESQFYNMQQTMTIYQLLKKFCSSKFGCKLLQQQLQQPIRNINELKLNYNTIDFILRKLNGYKLEKLCNTLKYIEDIAVLFKSIELKPNLSGNKWFQFKRTLLNLLKLITLCNELITDVSDVVNENNDGASGSETVPETIFHLIGTNPQLKSKPIRNGLITLDVIIDINETIQQKQFVCKQNFDVNLDRKRLKMIEIQNLIRDAFFEETKNIPSYLKNIDGYYIPEIGYVLQIKLNNIDYMNSEKSVPNLLAELENESLKFLCNSGDSYFFKTSLCTELNQEYGQIYYDILEHEQRICSRLTIFLREILSDLLELIKHAGKLDSVIAMAIFSKEYDLTRPEIHFENKIEIIDGWHLLSAILSENSQTKFIRNSTKISLQTENLITILQAPNSSGKSIYMKQIGLIFYLAHCGCFVPAKVARIFLLDSIMTCLYRNESVHNGSSSFLLDLQQISRILMSPKQERNLILIDEFGSGTVSEEGEALLCTVIEEFLKRGNELNSVVLIATHYLDISKFINETFSNEEENNFNGERPMGISIDQNCALPNTDKKKILNYKTFENLKIEDLDKTYLISTYKLIDGHCEHKKYAKKIYCIKNIIHDLFNLNMKQMNNKSVGNTESKGNYENSDQNVNANVNNISNLNQNLKPQLHIEFTYEIIKLFNEYLITNEDSIETASPEEIKTDNFNEILRKIKLNFFQN